MSFITSAKTITRVLVVTVLFLTLAGLGVRFIRYVWGDEGLLQLLRLFDVGEEGSIPTWYSSFTLLLSSILLAVIAALKRMRGDRYTLHWIGLSLIFLFLSIDEVVQIHEAGSREEVQSFVKNLTGLTFGGFTYFFWVVPGAAFVLIFLLVYLRFLVDLPKETRRLFLVAGILFVGGALGLEMLSARVVSIYGIEDWESVGGLPKIVVGIQTSIEELLEMLGIIVFIHALVAYIGAYVESGITIQVRIDDGSWSIPLGRGRAGSPSKTGDAAPTRTNERPGP